MLKALPTVARKILRNEFLNYVDPTEQNAKKFERRVQEAIKKASV